MAKNRINIIVKTKLLVPSRAALAKTAAKTLKAQKARRNAGLNILITDDRGIAKLNKRFLGRNGPTDVIAFGPGEKNLLGEIAISADTALSNAKRFGTAMGNEIHLYIIHGILHLLGYDDGTNKEKTAMEKRQAAILGQICR